LSCSSAKELPQFGPSPIRQGTRLKALGGCEGGQEESKESSQEGSQEGREEGCQEENGEEETLVFLLRPQGCKDPSNDRSSYDEKETPGTADRAFLFSWKSEPRQSCSARDLRQEKQLISCLF
jgi:hypothetical protein